MNSLCSSFLNCLPTYQSGFRTNHPTETALLSLLSDIYSAIDKSQLSLLALFDVSAAFDMVDHEILLERLETHVICLEASAI